MANVKMIAPIGFIGTLQTSAGNYTPDAFGQVTVDQSVVQPLLAAGWSVVNTPTIELVPAENALTAFAGGGQTSAVALSPEAVIHRVTTVGTAADSVKLPAATVGAQHVVVNAAAANAMAVFPNTGDIINALSANASISVAANKVITFFCAVAGTWNSLLTA